MTRLVWGLETQRKYENGVDRCVLYREGVPGVVWNGVTNIDEITIGGEVESLYFDGIKYMDLVGAKNFQANLTAFSAPEQFLACVGERPVVPGFVLTRQPRERFGLSYRTLVGDDGYKIHIVYNALANPTGKKYSSLSPSVSHSPYSWTIDATPPPNNTIRPSAHFIFDSLKMDPDALSAIEDVLYGTLETEPRLPSLDELFDIMIELSSLTIIPDTVGGLADLVSGDEDLYMTRIPGIHRALPSTRLVETGVEGLYELEL